MIFCGRRTVVATSASFPHGMQGFSVPVLPGRRVVHLAATDLAGNFHRRIGALVRASHRQTRPANRPEGT